MMSFLYLFGLSSQPGAAKLLPQGPGRSSCRVVVDSAERGLDTPG